jgi:predicted O-methyltransferase YrrM
LEIGVYLGFSAMLWSEAVGPTGSVVGLELSDEYVAKANAEIQKRGIKNIKIHEGNAHSL